jgi:hypothetical protein
MPFGPSVQPSGHRFSIRENLRAWNDDEVGYGTEKRFSDHYDGKEYGGCSRDGFENFACGSH